MRRHRSIAAGGGAITGWGSFDIRVIFRNPKYLFPPWSCSPTMPGNLPWAPAGFTTTASVGGPYGSCHCRCSNDNPSNSIWCCTTATGVAAPPGPSSNSLYRARATGRHASTLPNIGCRNDNRAGSCIVCAAHSPYAPIMFAIMVHIFADSGAVCKLAWYKAESRAKKTSSSSVSPPVLSFACGSGLTGMIVVRPEAFGSCTGSGAGAHLRPSSLAAVRKHRRRPTGGRVGLGVSPTKREIVGRVPARAAIAGEG